MFKFIILVLLIVVSSCLDKYKVSYDEVPQKIRSKPDYMSLIILSSSDKNCVRCEKGNSLFDIITKDLEDIIQFFYIDCAETDVEQHKPLEEACKHSILLPHLTFFEQYDNNNPLKQWPRDHIYQGEVDVKPITNYIYNTMIDYVKYIETKVDLTQFENNKQYHLKAIYITNGGDLPLHIKALASHLYHNITFAIIDSDNKLSKKFDTKSYPALILQQYNYETNNMTESYYKGPDKYAPMRKWLDKFISTFKVQSTPKVEKEVEKEFVAKSINYTDLQNNIKKHDDWVLLHLREGDSHPMFESIQVKYGAFFKYLDVSCDASCLSEAKRDLEIEKLPAIVVFPLGAKNYRRIIHIKDEYEDEDELVDVFLKQVPMQIKSIGDSPLQEFLQPALNSSKYPIITLLSSDDKFTKLLFQSFQAMTKYQDTLVFGKRVDPPMNQVKDVNPDGDLPYTFGILEVKGTNFQKAEMDKKKTVKAYFKFLDELHKRKIEEEVKTSKPKEINDIKVFEEECQSSSKPCIIGVFSKVREGRFKIDMEAFQKAKTTDLKRRYNWLWIDGNCHMELLKLFQLTSKDLNFILYYDQAKQKYKILKDQFTESIIDEFVESLRSKKSTLKELAEELDLEENNCDLINEDLKYKLEEEKQKKRDAVNKPRRSRTNTTQTSATNKTEDIPQQQKQEQQQQSQEQKDSTTQTKSTDNQEKTQENTDL